MKVYTKAQYDKPIYGIGKVSLTTKENRKTHDLEVTGFALTAMIEGEDGEQTKKTWTFDDINEALPDNIPDGFELEEKVKYAFVLASDESGLKFIRPANLRGANLKFAGFLMNDDGDYNIKSYDAKKDDKPTGKKILKFTALWNVVNEPYAGFQYPQNLPFTNSYGEPHFNKKGKDWSIQGNAEWKGKKTQYGSLVDFLNVTGISGDDAVFSVPKDMDPQNWLAALEQTALDLDMVVVGCDTTDGYISAWGESIPDEDKPKKKSKVVSKPVVDEDDDEVEETPAPKAAKKKVVEPVDEDEEEDEPVVAKVASKAKTAVKRQAIPDDDDD